MLRFAGFVAIVVFCSQLPVIAQKPAISETDRVIQELLEDTERHDEVQARKKWSYDRLVQSSDAVVIATFVDKRQVTFTRDDAKSLEADGGVIAIESRFKVLAALRADKRWQQQTDAIQLLHFAWDKDVIVLTQHHLIDFSIPVFERPTISVQGPEGMTLSPTNERSVRRVDQFLLFLAARPDGRYQPVTGQFFPNLSVRRIDSGI